MAENNKHDKDNLIDLASERRRFQNRPAQTTSKKFGTNAAYVAGKKTAGKKTQIKAGPRWYHYLQLMAFLALLAWMMQRCQSGGF